jgi:hypothetical protein
MGRYSERSRSSIIEQIRLQAEVRTLEDKKAIAERGATDRDKEVKRLRQAAITTNDPIVDYNFSQALADKNAKLDVVKSCEEGIQEKQTAIMGLSPSDQERKTRTERQASMESLLRKRLEIDREISSTVEVLRGLLSERRRQMDEIRTVAAALEIGLPAEGFDSAALLSALPDGIAEASGKSMAHFLGEPKGGKTYIVRAEYLSVAETLAHHGCYQFGEEIALEPEEAAELLANDYAAPVRSAPWRRLPARVMTVEDFRRAQAQADEKKVPVAQIIFEQDLIQDGKDRAYYLLNKVSLVTKPRKVWKDEEIRFGTAQRVSGRALGNIEGPRVGESHKPGELLQGLTVSQAWELVDTGYLGAL